MVGQKRPWKKWRDCVPMTAHGDLRIPVIIEWIFRLYKYCIKFGQYINSNRIDGRKLVRAKIIQKNQLCSQGII